MPAAFPPCVGRGIPDAPLLPRSGRPAPPPFFPVQAGLVALHESAIPYLLCGGLIFCGWGRKAG